MPFLVPLSKKILAWLLTWLELYCYQPYQNEWRCYKKTNISSGRTDVSASQQKFSSGTPVWTGLVAGLQPVYHWSQAAFIPEGKQTDRGSQRCALGWDISDFL